MLKGIKARNRTFGSNSQRLCRLVIEPQGAVEPAPRASSQKKGARAPL